ncbi:MAG: cytochrome c biogenesis protein ResB [Peptococcaceae bacterium]
MLKKLASMKFGIVLMVLIIISAVFSTIVPGEDHPNLARVIQGIPKLLIIILLLNLTFCTFYSFPKVWRSFYGNIGPEQLKTGGFKADRQFHVANTGEYAEFCETYFLNHKYKFERTTDGEKFYYQACKGKLSLLAPHFLHIGLALVLLGGLAGTYLGAESQVAAKIGDRVWVPNEVAPNMYVQIDNFATIYDKKGNIANWQSDISIIVNGLIAQKGSASVNNPFKYKGVKFYQTAYEVLHRIKVSGKDYSADRIIADRTFDRMTCVLLGEVYYLEQGKAGITLTIFKDKDTYRSYPLQAGDILTFPRGTLTYLKTEYNTVLTAKKDPGIVIVMLGFLIMSVSSLLFWQGRFKGIDMVLNPAENLVEVKLNRKGKALSEDVLEDLFPAEAERG